MKKKILFIIIALAGFMFAGVQSATAQMDYSVNFSWNEDSCSCSKPITKMARVILTDVVTNATLDDSGWYKVSGLFNIYDSNAAIILDTQNRYRLTIAVVYMNGTTVCCSGSSNSVWDGDDFLDTIPFGVIMLN